MILYSSTFLLLSNAVSLRRDKSILYARIAISILVCCLLLCLSSSYLRFIDNGVGLFGGLYHITSINTSFHIFIFLVTAFILQLNGFYPRKVSVNEIFTKATINSMYNKFTYFNTFILNKFSQQFKIIEYPLIIIFVIIGAVFLMSSCDLVSLFLSIELQSYGLYILCALYRNSERSVSAGLTYFLLGGLSSCFILLGFSLLYSNSGNTSFDGLYIINSISNATLENNKLIFSWYESYYLNISLMIISIGFLFKISAAPFHFWSPDVYDAIPTIVTTFVAIIAKISIFIVLLELVHFTKNIFLVSPAFTENNISWTITLLISSLLSLIIGSVLGLTQFRIKRLFAYSTISHVGFILLALSINTIESIQSFIFYLMQYSVTNLNAFLLLIMLGFVLYCYVEKKDIEKNAKPEKETNKELVLDKNNSPIQLISQLQGYFHINSYLAVSLAITIFSFVGVPPLMGFFAKQMILSSALDNGYVFMAFVAILTSVIGAYYYLAIIKQMFFHNTNYVMNPSLENITINGVIKDNNKLRNTTIFTIDNISLSSGLTVSVSLLTLTILLFILIPDEWLNMANILALILFKV